MRRAILFTFFSTASFAQPRPTDPFDLTLQEYWKMRNEGRLTESAAKREEALAMLERTPAEDPQFARRAISVVQSFQDGSTVRARAVAESALARASRLAEGNPARAMLLQNLAESWRNDGSLLKAVKVMEQAAAAAEAAKSAPPGNPAGAPAPVAMARLSLTPVLAPMPVSVNGRWFSRPYGGPSDAAYVYQRLADLYHQIGRPEAAAGARAKARALLQNNEMALAALYQSEGQTEEAAALYEKRAANAADPAERASALQSLAQSHMAQGRRTEAVTAIQQALATLEGSGKPALQSNANFTRVNLANALQQAGRTEDADRVWQQALEESRKNQGQEVPILANYSTYLATTKRGAQAETALKDYLAAHSNLDGPQQAQLYFSLANIARMSGDSTRAEQYQLAGMEKQPGRSEPVGQVLIGKDIERARSAVMQGNAEEGFSLILQAIDRATGAAADRDQLIYTVPSIADTLAHKNQPAKADQLYQRLFALGETFSPEPYLNLWRQYIRHLIQHPDRRVEAPAAIARHRNALIASHGPESGRLAEIFQFNMELERAQGSMAGAISAGQELVAFQKSLNGGTSEPYLQAIQTLALMHESAGDFARSLPLRLEAVKIADLVSRPNDTRPAQIRRDAAMALASHQRFDEAEQLAVEAARLGASLQPSQEGFFAQAVEHIRAMKKRPL